MITCAEQQAITREAALPKIPTNIVPKTLAPWVQRLKDWLAAQTGDKNPAVAIVIETEPKYYDDQQWHPPASRAWTRRANGEVWAGSASRVRGIDTREDYALLKMAIARAANTLGGRSWRYELDVGAEHIMLSSGSRELARPLLLQPGPKMAEADIDPELAKAMLQIGATLLPLQTTKMPRQADGGPVLPEKMISTVRDALRLVKDKPVETCVTRLAGGGLAMHAVLMNHANEAYFSKLLAVVPAGQGIMATTEAAGQLL
jgi:hypothetical protein